VIDQQRAESEEHRASIRRRRSALADAGDEDTEEIVGVYASHNEVRQAASFKQTQLCRNDMPPEDHFGPIQRLGDTGDHAK